MQEAELTYIEGTVDAVIYQNRENGYTVLRLDAGEGRGLTVVGCLPGVAPGESISVQGTWMHHASYGEQFKAEAVERRMPAGTKAIFDYLASGAVRGIGAATARRMVEEFGEEALTVLEEHPERLTQIKGITRKRALAMGEHFRQQMGMRRLLEFLGEHEVPLQLAMPLYRKYGDRALEIIRGNPYLLVDRELGVDFSNADALALSMGMEGDDPQRLEAGLLFELTHNLDNGHTFLPRRKLLPATAQLIGVGEEALEEALEALLERGEVVEEPVAGEQAVYLHDLCEAEQYVAFRLWELAAGEIVAPHGLEELIDRIQAEQGITYAPQQRQAVELAATSQVMLLTGGPGTGKTTSLRGVLALFDALGLETALAAPTGRAAKRLGELCGAEGTTIHRLLETQYDPHSGRLVFAHDESDPLKADAVIVDETSMVDITLMHGLLSALRPECRLILVGDPRPAAQRGAGQPVLRPYPQRGDPHGAPDRDLPAGRRERHRPQRPRGQPGGAARPAGQQARLLLPPPQGAGPGGGDHRGAGEDPAAQQHGHPAGADPGALPHPQADGGHRVAEPGHPGGGEPARPRPAGAPLRRVHIPPGRPGDAGAQQLRCGLEGRPHLRHGGVQRGYRPGGGGGQPGRAPHGGL